jgi:hypothetical protein
MNTVVPNERALRTAYEVHLQTLRATEKHAADYIAALADIRDRELWRLGDFESFEAFRKENCRLSDRHMRTLFAVKEVREQLSNASGPTGPVELGDLSDKAVRELASVPKEERVGVLDKAAQAARGKPVTAKVIKEAKTAMARPASMGRPAADGRGGNNHDTPEPAKDDQGGKDAPQERKPKSGAERVSPKDRKEACKAFGVVRRFVAQVKGQNALADELEAIRAVVEGR